MKTVRFKFRKTESNSIPRLWLYLPVVLSLAAFSLGAEGTESPRGVVVARLTQNSEGSNADLRPGDTLLSWSRGGARGVIRSPFDLMRVEVEQAPLGTVTIEGSTQSQERTWKLGQEDWGIETRPNFSAAGLTLYLDGRRLVRRGETKQAYAAWRSIELHDIRQPWIYFWCAGDAAELMGQLKRWRATDQLYRDAVRTSEGDLAAQLFLLRRWIPAFEERGDWDAVARLQRRTLSNGESLDGEGLVTALALSDLALVTDWRRDLKTADQLYRRALVIDKKLAPESLATARTLIRLAMVSFNRNDERSAEEFLEEARPLLQRISPTGPDSARFNGELASLFIRRGDLSHAKEHMTKAREMLEARWPDSLDLAGVLSSLSFISARQGDLNGAELQLRRASAIYDKKPINPDLGFNLSNDLGVLAYERRDTESAERYGRKTETILGKIAPDSIDHAGCLMNLGMYALEDDNLDASSAYWLRAFAIIHKQAPGSAEEAKILTGLASTAIRRGDLRNADRYASAAQQILEQIEPTGADMADALGELATIARRRGDLREAEEDVRRALAIEENLVPTSADCAETIASLAGILEEKGQTEEAIIEYEHAISILEGQMARLGGSEITRSAFRASHHAIYERDADLLVQQGKTDQAFEVVERSRARTLLELLTEGNIRIGERAGNSLRDEEESLQRQFAKESDHRIRLLTGPHSDEQVKSSDAKIAGLLEKFTEVESQIRATNPAYAELTQPHTATVKAVQDRLLDPDTLLLEYSLGERRSYLWLVSSHSFSTYVLPGRAEIESEARHAYKELTAPGLGAGGASKSERPATSRDALSRMILGPVERRLNQKRLLIVADGALNYIPFAALKVSGAVSPLIADHEIISLPSASVLLALRHEHAGRQQPPQSVAVLADPVFDSYDPRVKHSGSIVPAVGSQLASPPGEGSFAALRSIELARARWAKALGLETGGPVHFPRLAYSRREAQRIIAAAPAGHSLEALDFKASRLLAMSPDLAQFKILHFATHGFVDTMHPEFSGLLFSLFDERGEPQIGLLSLEDIYNLKLPVDMVVLSACETALGKEVKGEGLMGLTQGFMYAGASRVTASLWKVNDVATASLMGRFYRAIEQDHLPAAAALREAQLEMQHDKRWAAPYYWASFELQGEWK